MKTNREEVKQPESYLQLVMLGFILQITVSSLFIIYNRYTLSACSLLKNALCDHVCMAAPQGQQPGEAGSSRGPSDGGAGLEEAVGGRPQHCTGCAEERQRGALVQYYVLGKKNQYNYKNSRNPIFQDEK